MKILIVKMNWLSFFSAESWDTQLACSVYFTSIRLKQTVLWSCKVRQKISGRKWPVSPSWGNKKTNLKLTTIMNMNTVKKLQVTANVVMNQNVTFIRSNFCIVTEHIFPSFQVSFVWLKIYLIKIINIFVKI